MPNTNRQSLARAPRQIALRVTRLGADPQEAIRLRAMGICAGRIVSIAQAGDPMIVVSCGTRIGLAADIAAAIDVEPINQSLQESAPSAGELPLAS